nr:hypothetical protein [Nocardia niwae]
MSDRRGGGRQQIGLGREMRPHTTMSRPDALGDIAQGSIAKLRFGEHLRRRSHDLCATLRRLGVFPLLTARPADFAYPAAVTESAAQLRRVLAPNPARRE